MTKDEKQLIEAFLDTAESYIKGFPVRTCAGENPLIFTDSEAHNGGSTIETHRGGLTINDLNEKIANCTRCALFKTRKNTVPGTGCTKPLVLVVGEGPGADEDEQGLPFVGKAGQLLDKMLAAINISRSTNCYIANIVKCRPPQNREPHPEEAAACLPFLHTQIHILKPTAILAVGRIAAQHLLQTSEPIGKIRGKFYEYQGIPLTATYHPSALLRDESLKRPAWEDLKALRSRLEQITGGQY